MSREGHFGLEIGGDIVRDEILGSELVIGGEVPVGFGLRGREGSFSRGFDDDISFGIIYFRPVDQGIAFADP